MVLKTLLATLSAFAVVAVCSQVSLADDKPSADAGKKPAAKTAPKKESKKASSKKEEKPAAKDEKSAK